MSDVFADEVIPASSPRSDKRAELDRWVAAHRPAAGVHAAQSQHDKASDDCLRMWPDPGSTGERCANWNLVTGQLEDLVLAEVGRSSLEEVLEPKVTLLWRATSNVVPLDPEHDVADMVRATYPQSESLQCDHCDNVVDRGGFLVLPHPPRLVVLTICQPCAEWFNTLFDPIRWVLPTGRND
jgi:hypothetical protein